MLRNTLVISFAFVMSVITQTAFATSRVLTIDEALRLAARNSPRLSAARFHELVAKKAVGIARANYYPTLNLEAIDSKGFPGSSGLLGIGGLMGSPYRSGIAEGVVVQQTISDFGRTYYDVAASQQEVKLSEQETRVTLYEVKQLALQIYYECAYFRSQQDTWRDLSKRSSMITKEAQRFVETGQASIVDRYLSKAQTEEARTAYVYFAEQLRKSEQELAVIIGIAPNFSCPRLPKQVSSFLQQNNGYATSPILAKALAGKQVALAHLHQEKSAYYPKIVAVASAGNMEKARLVTKKNHAIGIGITFPVLDLHTTAKVQTADAELMEKTQEVEAQKRYLQEMNAKYDAIISASKIRLYHLDQEFKLAAKAFNTSKHRYFALEGTLIDLREAFRNVVRVESAIHETRMRYLQASGSKALLNGSGQIAV